MDERHFFNSSLTLSFKPLLSYLALALDLPCGGCKALCRIAFLHGWPKLKEAVFAFGMKLETTKSYITFFFSLLFFFVGTFLILQNTFCIIYTSSSRLSMNEMINVQNVIKSFHVKHFKIRGKNQIILLLEKIKLLLNLLLNLVRCTNFYKPKEV